MAKPGTPDILKKIVANKRREVEQLKLDHPMSELRQRIDEGGNPAPLNLAGALMGDEVRVIAEVKKASPSKGLLRPDFDPTALAEAYATNGAAAVSVLTDADYFQGSVQHLAEVRRALTPHGIPVLRKEFIVDPYQVYEARAYGADAILLIVSVLTATEIGELMSVAGELWMQCLVEVHDEDELQIALEIGAEIVGINNRNLHTFVTDLSVTERLAPMVPQGKIVVSESGIDTRDDIGRVARAGAHAVLIGEALVTAADPGKRLRGLL
jgi:indole-3-glycerol phosphate synthase